MAEDIWRGDVRTEEAAVGVALEAYRLHRASFLRLADAGDAAVRVAVGRAHTSADRGALERAADAAVKAEIARLTGPEGRRL